MSHDHLSVHGNGSVAAALDNHKTRPAGDLCGGSDGRVSYGNNSHAVREYRALCILQPTHVEHFERLALLYKRLGKRDQARQAAKNAVDIDPDSPVRVLLSPVEN